MCSTMLRCTCMQGVHFQSSTLIVNTPFRFPNEYRREFEILQAVSLVFLYLLRCPRESTSIAVHSELQSKAMHHGGWHIANIASYNNILVSGTPNEIDQHERVIVALTSCWHRLAVDLPCRIWMIWSPRPNAEQIQFSIRRYSMTAER